MDFINLTDCIKMKVISKDENGYVVDVITWGIFNKDIPPLYKITNSNYYALVEKVDAETNQFIYMSRLAGVDMEVHNE